MELNQWVRKQRDLLQLEKEEETSLLRSQIEGSTSQQCQEKGISVLNLWIHDTRTSLFGRTTYTFGRYNKDQLSAHSFKVNDEICFYSQKVQATKNSEVERVDGIVTKVTSTSIDVVCENDDHSLAEPIRIDMRANETTHNKMMQALGEMAERGQDSKLVNLMFHNYDSSVEEIHSLLGVRYPPAPRPEAGAQSGAAAADVEACYSSVDGDSDSVADEAAGSTASAHHDAASHLMRVGDTVLKCFNKGLNESQREAIRHSITSPHLALIHGPPGTGKTSTVAEFIVQAVRVKRQKILVSCPSNVAVDNLLERIADRYPAAAQPSMVRIGHPARISASIQSHCLEALIARADGTEIVGDVRKELDGLRKSVSKEKNKSAKREKRAEMRELQKEIRKREEAVLQEILKSRDVVFCTCVGAASRLLRNIDFDIVVIDEAAQALEVCCWIPILRANKCILAGDHCQLPPTVKSKVAEAGGLAVTLFERIMKNPKFCVSVPRLLNTQYRMNDLICRWASHAMYNDRLLSAEEVASRTLADIVHPPVPEPAQLAADGAGNRNSGVVVSNDCVMLLIDTAGCFMEEQKSDKGSSRNTHEVDLVWEHIDSLVRCNGVNPRDIGVITPYNGQLEALRERLHHGKAEESPASGSSAASSSAAARDFVGNKTFPEVEIRTVDGFQGGEKEVIILSFVRSNEERNVGFLSDARRINVAVTRAKRHVAVICDSETCSSDKFLRNLIDYVSQHGEHRSAMEYRSGAPAEAVSAPAAVVAAASRASKPQDVKVPGADDVARDSAAAPQSVVDTKPAVAPKATTSAAAKPPVATQKKNTSCSVPAAGAVSSSASVGGPSADGVLAIESVLELLMNTLAKDGTEDGATMDKKESDLRDLLHRGTCVVTLKQQQHQHYFRVCAMDAAATDAKRKQAWPVLVDQKQQSVLSVTTGSATEKSGEHPILRFPVDLTPFHRKMLHSLAEDLKLFHRTVAASATDDRCRYIEVSRTAFQSEAPLPPPAPQSSQGGSSSGAASSRPTMVPGAKGKKLNAGAVLVHDGSGSAPKAAATEAPLSKKQQLQQKHQQPSKTSATNNADIRARNSAFLDRVEASVKAGPAVAASAGGDNEESSSVAAVTAGVNSMAVLYHSDDEEEQGVSTSKVTATVTTEATASSSAASAAATAKQLKKQRQKEKKAAAADVDEDALMDEMIKKNRELADERKYRVSCAAFPHLDGERHKSSLKEKLDAAKAQRTNSTPASSAAGGGGPRKKVLKKPPPNFGGGKPGSA